MTGLLSPGRRVGGTPPGLGGLGLRKQAAPLAHHFGLEWWLDLPVLQFLPVDPPEEGVFSHVPFPLGPAAQTLAGMFGHQLESRGEDLRYSVVTTVGNNVLDA